MSMSAKIAKAQKLYHVCAWYDPPVYYEILSDDTPWQKDLSRMANEGIDVRRWDAAYDSPKNSKVPEDFQTALDASPGAREFFQYLDGANRYAVLFRIQTVKKAETRVRKIREFVEMMERNETIHEPLRARRQSK